MTSDAGAQIHPTTRHCKPWRNASASRSASRYGSWGTPPAHARSVTTEYKSGNHEEAHHDRAHCCTDRSAGPGCSSAPKAETLAASPAATYVSQIPRPDAAQTVALPAELAKINPLLGARIARVEVSSGRALNVLP
jgi:hypothetical protein